MQPIINSVFQKTGKNSTTYGFLRYDNNRLGFFSYKQLYVQGKVHVVYFLILKLIELFRSEKLILDIPKDSIASLKIEEGKEFDGMRGRLARLTRQQSKEPDQFVITTKDGNEYKFILDESEESRNSVEFQNLVMEMGMYIS